MHLEHHHQTSLVILSYVIAIFASYTALDLINSMSLSRDKSNWLRLIGGSLAMGIGIWSMHFIGMLAFRLPGVDIYYDVPLVILSIFVAILASAVALFIVSSRRPSRTTYFTGSMLMGTAIAGMHYIGIASMRMAATVTWNRTLVFLSVLIAFVASYSALFSAFNLKEDNSLRGFVFRGIGGLFLGFAIAGMHYTGMKAMNFTLTSPFNVPAEKLLASTGLAPVVIIATLLILGIALTGSNIDRALTRRTLVNEVLQEGIRVRDEFVSLASHELRTPLTTIKLQTALAIRQMSQEDFDKVKVLGMLQKSEKSLNHLNQLVEDLLDISRVSSGRLSLDKEDFNLAELLTDVIDRFKPLLQKAGSEIQTNLVSKVVGNWDRFRIEQVIVNILSNAAKYAPGKPIEVKLSEENNVAMISIRDHGKGIAPEDQERIFKRFERASDTGSQNGLGLGLFIANEIISMHGGDIKLRSAVDEGSEFIIHLPQNYSQEAGNSNNVSIG